MSDAVLSPFRPPDAGALNGAHPPVEIRAEMTEITPAMAREWMERHRQVVEARKVAGMGKARDNRPIRWGDVAGWARDMKAGKWRPNGETVKVDWDEAVMDGQHRLYACMQAEVSFRCLVVTGVDPDDQDTVDIGIKRKLGDQLAINGETNTAALAAISRWSLRWLKGVRGGTYRSGGTFNPTQQEILDYIALTPHLRDAAAFAMHAYQSFRSIRPSAYGMGWLLFNGSNPIAAKVFFDGLLTGAGLSLQHPVLVFRDRLLTARDRGERLGESTQLGYMIIAWNAFTEDKSLGRRDFPAVINAKNFPEPK
jgi:hypothetical protein